MLLSRIIPSSSRSIPKFFTSTSSCPTCTYLKASPIASTSKQLFHSTSNFYYSTQTTLNSELPLPPLPIVTVAPTPSTPVKRKPRVFTSRKAAIELVRLNIYLFFCYDSERKSKSG